MKGIAFDKQSAKRIADTVRRVEAMPQKPQQYRRRRWVTASANTSIANLWVVSLDVNWEMTCQRIRAANGTYEPIGETFTVHTYTYDVDGLDWTEVDPPIVVTTPGNQAFIPAVMTDPQNEWYCIWRIIGTC